MRKFVAGALVLVVACTAETDVVRQPRRDSATMAPRVAALDSAIERRRQELRIPGAAVALVSDTAVLFLKGYGMRDVQSQRPVTPATVFAIGSCTKPFTSLAIGIASDLGLLSLDDSPRQYLPWFQLRDSVANANATFRDLLSHRTGVRIDDAQGWYERHPTPESLIRFAMQNEPAKPFRQAFQYNNFMYVAAAEALAAAAREPYVLFMSARVFAPLGMLSTRIRTEDIARAPDISLGYTGESGAATRTPVSPARLRWLDGIAAAGGIFSSASDMSRWMRMMVAGGTLDGQRVISDSSYAALLAPAVATGNRQYALGWFVEQWHGHTLYSHPGGVTGFGARCEFVPSQRLGWVVLANVDDGQLATTVRQLIYDHIIAADSSAASSISRP